MVEIENNKEIEKVERQGFGYIPFTAWLDEEDLSKGIEQYEENHYKKKLLIKEILLGWEKARNNDFLMVMEAYRTEFPEIEVTDGKINVIFKIPKKIVKFLPPPESYRRARQSLILDCKRKGDMELLKELMPTDPFVIIQRMKTERIMHDFFASEKYKERAKVLK